MALLIPSIDITDDVVPDAASDDGILEFASVAKNSVRRNTKTSSFDWQGLAPSTATTSRRLLNEPVQASWSFQDAIASIDAASTRRSGTSLQEKVNMVVAAKQQDDISNQQMDQNETNMESNDDTDEEEKDMEEDDEDTDANDSDNDEEEDEANDEESSDDENDSNEEEEESNDAPAVGDSKQTNPEASKTNAINHESENDDFLTTALASSRPNPLRNAARREAFNSANMSDEYAGMFEPDPFELAACDGKKGAKKTSANGEENDAGGDDAVRLLEQPTAGSKRRLDTAKASSSSKNPPSTSTSSAVPLSEPQSFVQMNLSRPLLRAVAELGFTAPTPIQRRAIPLALAGHDVCASAVTGSGKTAAYLLPILERLQYKPAKSSAIRALVLTPTRELAAQVQSMCAALAVHCRNIRAAVVVGGVPLKGQEVELRSKPDIVIATPGRMLDHIQNTLAVHCDDVDVLVLDEADRLLEMGFEEELLAVVRACPVSRQTLLFSATMTARVETLVKLSLHKPVRISADPLYDTAAQLSQEFIRVRAGRESDREALVLALLTRSLRGGGILVFATRKQEAHRLAILFHLAGISCSELHGNLTQRQRLAALEDFRMGAVDVLVATDLAGRGLDISGVRAVVNLEMPRDLTTYVHRVGRTARAGRAGVAVTLVNDAQRSLMREIVKRAALNVKARSLPPDAVSAWRTRIENWEDSVSAVLAAEREERELRRAEMEVDKANNMLDHRDEIAARPARTWFQTEREKAATKAAAAEAAAAAGAHATPGGASSTGQTPDQPQVRDAEHARSDVHRLTRKKRRRMEAAAEEGKEARRIARAEATLRRSGSLLDGRKGAKRPSGREDDTEAAALQRLQRDKKRLELLRTAAHSQHAIAKKAKAQHRMEKHEAGTSAGVARKRAERAAKIAAAQKYARKQQRKQQRQSAEKEDE